MAQKIIKLTTVEPNSDTDLRIGSNDLVEVFNAGTTVSGTTDATTADKLDDSLATFQTDGVQVGWFVYNSTDNTSAKVTAVDSETVLSLDADIFTTGEDYAVQSDATTVVFTKQYADKSQASVFETPAQVVSEAGNLIAVTVDNQATNINEDRIVKIVLEGVDDSNVIYNDQGDSIGQFIADEDQATIVAAASNLIDVTVGADTLTLNADRIIEVANDPNGAGALLRVDAQTAGLEDIVVDETPAAVESAVDAL